MYDYIKFTLGGGSGLEGEGKYAFRKLNYNGVAPPPSHFFESM